MSRNGLSYAEKLKDPRWQKLRLEILERDAFTCQNCDSTTTTLHVHHRRYLKGKDPWDIPVEYLVTLCEACHQEVAESEERILDCLTMINVRDLRHLARTLVYTRVKLGDGNWLAWLASTVLEPGVGAKTKQVLEAEGSLFIAKFNQSKETIESLFSKLDIPKFDV